MPIGLWNLPWPVANSQRKYPLANSATGIDQSGSFVLPDDFILSLYVPVHSGIETDASRFFIKNIGSYANGYSVVVGYQPFTGDAKNVATALINRETHEFDSPYTLGGRESFIDTIGHVVIGDLDNIDEQPQGFWTFDFEATRLEPDAIRPMIRGVYGLRVRNGTDVSELLTGVVELSARSNMQLDVDLSGANPKVVFSAIDGAGTVEDCVCDEAASRDPIYTVNGVTPDSSGNLVLVGDDCIEVSGIQNGIQLRDTCSAPCCSCEELEAITRDLEKFGNNYRTLEQFLVRLENSVSGMDLVVLGSKLSDRGCSTC